MTITNIREILEALYYCQVWKSFSQIQFTKNNLLANYSPLSFGKNNLFTVCTPLPKYNGNQFY